MCLPGYTGIDCRIDINDCDPDPCNNHSLRCIDGVNGLDALRRTEMRHRKKRVQVKSLSEQWPVYGYVQQLHVLMPTRIHESTL